jgi:Tol biopolymer transport system component
MTRNAILMLWIAAVCAVWACGEAPADRVDRAGAPSSLIPDHPWRWELPPPDTLDTVTRRVWYGDEVDPTGTPSPDGRFLTHPDMETGAVAVRDLATGETRLLTDYEAPYFPGFAMLPRFSPDGSQVAYTWWQNDAPQDYGLRVVGVDGGEPRVLGEPSGWIDAEGWAPDGRWILVDRATEDRSDMAFVSAEDGSVRVLRRYDEEGIGRMVLSPDGRFVFTEKPASPDDPYSRDLFALPVDGGPEIPVVRHPADEFVLGWAPSGEYVLFGSDRTGTPGAWLQRVRDAEPQGDPVLVKPDLWGVWGLGFTADGRFFYSVATGAREVHVATLDPESGRVLGSPEVLSPQALGSQNRPSWSPDGRYIAYLVEQFFGTSTSNPPTLAVRSVETGQERLLRLPPDVYLPREHYWLADGQSLLLRYLDRNMAAGIRRIDLRTGDSEVVFFRPEGEVYNSMITPDEQALVIYLREEEAESHVVETVLRMRDLESGEEREILRAPVVEGSLTGFTSLSPDGATVAAWHGPGTEVWARLLTIPLDGGEPREIPTPADVKLGYQVIWTPDQRFLITTRPDDPEDSSNSIRHLVRVNIETGEVQDMGLSGERIGYLRLSADGRQLAYVAGSESYEVWVMENFLPGRERD